MSDPRPWTGRRLHLVGIGGAGMSGYATVAAQLGATVSGSDRAPSAALTRLQEAGIAALPGHDAAQLPAGDDVEVVVSSAIGADNPEVAAARERGLRVMPRAELLHELSALRRTIAVAGRPWQDDDVEHDRARAAGLRDGPRVPDRRGAALDRPQRCVGDRRLARRGGR